MVRPLPAGNRREAALPSARRRVVRDRLAGLLDKPPKAGPATMVRPLPGMSVKVPRQI